MFPASYDRYIEVFGGGGWVLFGKPPDDRCMEIYNDYNSNLANLFYCVKNRTGAFLKDCLLYTSKYGMLRKSYLQEHRKAKYQILLLQGKLVEHLNQIDAEARDREEQLVLSLIHI